MDQQPRQLDLRKYPNRRYYDATRSRHVTLEEIHSLIRDGYEVQVTDSKTGQDITAKVLAQIIIDLDPPKLGVFPVPLLHRLLRSNEQLVNDFVGKWFSQPLAAFLDSQRSFEQYLRQSMGMRPAGPTVADWAGMMWGPFSPAAWTGGGAAAPGSPGNPAESSHEAVARRQQAGPSSPASSPLPPSSATAAPDPTSAQAAQGVQAAQGAQPKRESAGGEMQRDLRRSMEEMGRQLAELRQQLSAAPPQQHSHPQAAKGPRKVGRKAVRGAARKCGHKTARKSGPGPGPP